MAVSKKEADKSIKAKRDRIKNLLSGSMENPEPQVESEPEPTTPEPTTLEKVKA